jgi:hypothetical protein
MLDGVCDRVALAHHLGFILAVMLPQPAQLAANLSLGAGT